MPVIESDSQILTADGITDAVFCRPEGEGPWPGVLYLTDVGGIRPATREQARRLAGEGYVLLMPNLFCRTSKPPVLQVGHGDAEAFRKRVTELTAPLTPDRLDGDVSVYVDTLTQDRSCGQGKIGVVGYCFSGAVAMRGAAVRADRVGAAASFHGGRLYTEAPDSPHLLLPRIRAELYFGHATEDRSMPKEAIDRFEQALAAWGGRYTSETYEGALHGWTMPDSGAYNHAQAERAFGELLRLFGEKLDG